MDFSLSETQTELGGLARKILAERDGAGSARSGRAKGPAVGGPRRRRRARGGAA